MDEMIVYNWLLFVYLANYSTYSNCYLGYPDAACHFVIKKNNKY